jgi:hypothetical protein
MGEEGAVCREGRRITTQRDEKQPDGKGRRRRGTKKECDAEERNRSPMQRTKKESGAEGEKRPRRRKAKKEPDLEAGKRS